MTSGRDVRLQALFSEAEQALDATAFQAELMARIDRQRRRAVIVWSILSLVAVAVLAALAPPIVETIRIANQVLPVSLVEIETGWLRQVVSPINSIAATIAIGAVVIHRFFRRILR